MTAHANQRLELKSEEGEKGERQARPSPSFHLLPKRKTSPVDMRALWLVKPLNRVKT